MHDNRLFKIGYKLALIILMATLVSMITTSAIYHYQSQNKISALVEANLRAISSETSDHIRDVIKLNKDRINLISSRTQLRISLSEISPIDKDSEQFHLDKINKILLDAQHSVTDIKSITVTDLYGVVIQSTNKEIRNTFIDLAWITDSELKVNTNNDIRSLTLGSKLILDDKPIGFIYMEIDILPFEKLYKRLYKLSNLHELFIFYDNDKLLFPIEKTNNDEINSHFSELLNKYKNNKSSSMIDVTIDNSPKIVFYQPLSIDGWGIILSIDKESAFGVIDEQKGFFFSLLIVISLVLVLASIIIGKTISQPILGMADIANKISNGDLSKRINLNSNDELNILKNSINSMADKLVSENKHLDEKVKLKNEKLQYANSKLTDINQKLEAAQALARAGWWEYDIIRDCVTWPKETYQLFDVPEDTTLTYDLLLERIDPEFRDMHNENMQKLLETGNNEFKYTVTLQNGNKRWIWAKGTTEYNEKGEPLRLFGTLQDMTEEYKNQLAIAKINRELEHANSELEQYAYVVSHDLKSPLRAIHNYSTFIEEDMADEGLKLPEDVPQYLKGLTKAVQQCEQLVDDLLEYSRVGRKNTETQAIDLREILLEVLDGLQLPSDINVHLTDKWPKVQANHVMLRQVFINLITNAIKFNTSVPKEITLAWKSPSSGIVEVMVQDNGIGIEPNYQSKIFQVFQRLHASSEYEGSGIGLAIVKKAVETMGGKVRLESVIGEGSRFFITLHSAGEAHTEEYWDREI